MKLSFLLKNVCFPIAKLGFPIKKCDLLFIECDVDFTNVVVNSKSKNYNLETILLHILNASVNFKKHVYCVP